MSQLEELTKRVDALGETITVAKDPVDGAFIPVLGWEAVERILDKLQQPEPPKFAWKVVYLHLHCARCEDCAEAAIAHAKLTGSKGAKWTETMSRHGSDMSELQHQAVVERVEARS